MQVTLESAKNYLRVDTSDDDALIKGLITTAETPITQMGVRPEVAVYVIC